MKYVKFTPWVGKNYEQGFRGKKILILGDSHYCAKECSENGCCYPKCEFSPKCESAEEQNKKLFQVRDELVKIGANLKVKDGNYWDLEEVLTVSTKNLM